MLLKLNYESIAPCLQCFTFLCTSKLYQVLHLDFQLLLNASPSSKVLSRESELVATGPCPDYSKSELDGKAHKIYKNLVIVGKNIQKSVSLHVKNTQGQTNPPLLEII